jgi:transposase
MPPFRPLKERFSEKYSINPETGCWDWQGSRIPQGYGMINAGRLEGNKPAHRVAYELFVGAIPEGRIVCHRCDNPGCVNPEHLFVGTYQENMADMKRKGRARVLSETQVKEVLADLESGMLQTEVAAKFGVARSTIQNVVYAAREGDYGGVEPAKNIKKYVRLSDANIIEIVCLLHKGEMPILDIAEKYNVDRKTVRNIRDRMI